MATTEQPDVEMTGELRNVLDQLHESGDARTVYGEPVEREGVTVIPVARIGYGFGGGFGRGDEESDAGSGGGIGAGLGASPVGVVEITDHDTRFVPIPGRRQQAMVAATFLLGLVLGALLGRGRS
jgi:uncharacterized spore protein YtfJ